MKQVGVCIIFYDDLVHIPRLAQALKRQTFQDFDVFFCDNREGEPHVNPFSEACPHAVYVPSQGNRGFAGGNNLLAKKAGELGCEYVWVLNPDMEPEADCLLHLMYVIQTNASLLATGPVVCTGNSHSAPLIQVAGEQVDFFTQNKKNTYAGIPAGTLPAKEVMYTDSINGGSLLMPLSALKECGYFEEAYFMYNDETDLMYRIRLKEGKVGVSRNAICFHHHDWSKKNQKGYFIMYYYMMRNKVLYWKKFGMYTYLLGGLAKQFLLAPVVMAFCVRTAGRRLIYYYYLGWLHGIYGRKGKTETNFG